MINPDIISALRHLEEARASFFSALDTVRAADTAHTPGDGVYTSLLDGFAQGYNRQVRALADFARRDIIARYTIR